MNIYTFIGLINFSFFLVGMSAVWFLTHDWWVMLAAFVASIHLTIKWKP